MKEIYRKLSMAFIVTGVMMAVFPLHWEALGADVAEKSSASSAVALILYDGPEKTGNGLIAAREVANLLPHFGYRADIQPMATYAAGGTEKYPAVFICGMGDASVLPQALLTDVAQRNKTVCWINQFIGQLTSMPGMADLLGFSGDRYDNNTGYTSVSYHGIDLPKGNPDINRVKILNPNKVQVLATAGQGGDSAPYVLHSGNLWYFTGPVFSFSSDSDQSLIFADLLHDILGVGKAAERRALVRLEDVSAYSDPNELRCTADVLIAHNVPFQIALIPVFKDPQNHVEITLSKRPKIVEALQYMVAHGGTIIMHGVTHQRRGVSADDYEFWDTKTKHLTSDGSFAALSPRLERGFDVCFRAGLYPVAFETPHYAASLEHYSSLASVFSHCYERRMVTDNIELSQSFPYETTDFTGEAIIPENLGYVHAENPDIQPILKAARGLTVVRDPIASFFFHPFMPVKALDQILTALQADGYRFISIKDFLPSAALNDHVVSAVHRTFEITPKQPFLKTTTVDAGGAKTERFQAVKIGQPVSVDADPPAGGIVAIQGVSHAPGLVSDSPSAKN